MISIPGASNYQHFFDAEIFQSDEILGRMGDTIKPTDALALGQTLGHMYFSKGHRIVCVAYDERMSSFALEEELCRGLAWEGLFVMRLGHCTTAVAHFTMKMLQAHLTVVVTGGDAPLTHNGFRIFDNDGALCDERLRQISTYSKIGFNHYFSPGVLVNVNAINIYQEHIISHSSSNHDLTIVWNCDGGSIINLLQDIVHKIPGSHLLINDDASSQNLSENALAEGKEQLRATILEENASFGFLFNSDASVVYILDNEGELLSTYEIATILAEPFIKRYQIDKKQPILCDAFASLAFQNRVKELDHDLVFSSSGFANLMNDMLQKKGCIAVSDNGYISFSTPLHGCPDGLLVAIKFLEFASNQKEKFVLSEWRQAHQLALVTIKPLVENTPFPARQAILNLQNYANTNDLVFHQCGVDTLRFETQGGWWSVNPTVSGGKNSQITIRAEAPTKTALNQISGEIDEILVACSIKVPL